MSGLDKEDFQGFDVVSDQIPRAQENTPANEFVKTTEERRKAAEIVIHSEGGHFDVV